jgi:hypothetical protein
MGMVVIKVLGIVENDRGRKGMRRADVRLRTVFNESLFVGIVLDSIEVHSDHTNPRSLMIVSVATFSAPFTAFGGLGGTKL